MSGDAPSTTTVANKLDVDGNWLRTYAQSIPGVTPAAILGWANADPKHRDAVAAWLEELETKNEAHDTDATHQRGERV